MLDAAIAADEPKETATPEPAPEQPQAPSIEESARKALSLSDDDLVEVMVDGEPEQLPWKEARSKISGGLKFTKNMQQVAAERKALEADRAAIDQLRQENAEIKAFLQNPTAVVQYAQQLFGAVPEAPPAQNGDEIATIADARAIAEQQAAAFAAQIERVTAEAEARAQQIQGEIEFRQQVARHAATVTSTLESIFKANPELTAIPDAEAIIRYNVVQMNPQSEQEAVEAFHQVANGIVEGLNKHFKTTQKAQKIAAAKQKLETSTIEPPGGAAPQLKPNSFKEADGTVNWNKVRDGAREYLASL